MSWAIQTFEYFNRGAAILPSPKGLGFHAVKCMKRMFDIAKWTVLFFLVVSPLCSEDYTAINELIEKRWEEFQSDRSFRPFAAGKSEEALEAEFREIQKTRESIWGTVGYEEAGHLIVGDLVRAPGCVAFGFNNTVPDYNASTIWLNGRNYIACEGPRSKDIPSFFKMLRKHHATHLVRLTDSYEGEIKKCHPYWEGLLARSMEEGAALQLPLEQVSYAIRAYDLAHWRDNQGVDPRELLDLVLKVRRELKDGLLVVHCSAGVGRTGTFLAALAIVDAIEQNLPFSIEEIVYRLSLQRVHSVGKASQYITLHRLAERAIAN
jgi:hypothetical protein